VKLPEGVIAAKPMPKAGWRIGIERGPYAHSYSFYHGMTLNEGARGLSGAAASCRTNITTSSSSPLSFRRRSGPDRCIFR
jgi:hypothetical protein